MMRKGVVVLIALVLPATVLAGQEPDFSEFPPWFQAQMSPRTVPSPRSDSALIKSEAVSWAELIDETWGDGLSTGVKLFLFDTFWHAEYLTHDLLEVDHPVWLTPDDVAAGIDTVVEAAVKWIVGFEFSPRRATGRVAPP